jgi:hypothetical protein
MRDDKINFILTDYQPEHIARPWIDESASRVTNICVFVIGMRRYWHFQVATSNKVRIMNGRTAAQGERSYAAVLPRAAGRRAEWSV